MKAQEIKTSEVPCPVQLESYSCCQEAIAHGFCHQECCRNEKKEVK